MSLTIEAYIDQLKDARKHFLKHLKGVTGDQWTWKPYTECKSLLETVQHLITDDRAAYESMLSDKDPDYEALMVKEENVDCLLELLTKSHEQLCELIKAKYADTPADEDITIYGSKKPLGIGLPYLISEDFYHAGQVAFVRMAQSPDWDYYAAIYGPEA